MLFLLGSLLLMVIGIVCWILGLIDWTYDEYPKKKSFANSFKQFMHYCDEGFSAVGGLITVVFGIIFIFMAIIGLKNAITAPSKAAVYQERYKALVYKVESEACRDEFGLLNKEIIDEVQEWNTELVYRKKMHDSIWVGCFYPNIYDGLETIDYESYIRTPK